MKARTIITLIFSLGTAVLAAFLANNWISERLGASENTMLTGHVVIAVTDIQAGTKLDAAHVKLAPLPEESITEGNFTNLEDVIGQVTSQPLYNGEILIKRRLSQHASGSPLAAVIEKGKRALTVRVDDVIGVAGFLLPGSHVDVVSTKRQSGGQNTISRTIVENLKVLAVDQTVSSDKNDPVIVRAVTLEVSPRQAEHIVKATEEGKVQLTLRNPLDLAEQVPEPKPAPAAKKTVSRNWSQYRVDIIRGTDKSRAVFSK
jgi:pilus assembly protein CpaB